MFKAAKKISSRALVSLVGLGLVVSTAIPGAVSAQTLNCSDEEIIEGNVEWPTSGVQSGVGQNKVMIADSYRNKIYEVDCASGSIEAKLAGESTTLMGASIAGLRPSQVRAADDGFLVEDEENDILLRFDRQFVWTGEKIQIKGRDMGGGWKLQVLYDWVPLGDAGILGFGDLKRNIPSSKESKTEWVSAFVYFDKTAARIFSRVQIKDPIRYHYVNTNGYLAAVGSTGFILNFGPQIKIEKVEAGAHAVKPLANIPADFRDVAFEPKPGILGATQATRFLRQLEKSSAVVSLLAWNGELFALGKEPMDENKTTAWWLSRLDVQDGAELERVDLPTVAASVVPIVAEKNLVLLEKDPVEAVGDFNAPHSLANKIRTCRFSN